MSLHSHTMQFGIAILLFGIWMQSYGLNATPIPHIGLTFAGIAFLSSFFTLGGRPPASDGDEQ